MKKSLKFGFHAVPWLAAGLLAGCANPVFDGRLAWEDGWREGVVTDVGEGLAFAGDVSSRCKSANPSLPATARYLRITHKPVTGRVWLTVPAPADVALKPNDLVYVNVLDCGKRVERR